MNSAQLSGEQNSDEISSKGNKLKFNSNKAGGILVEFLRAKKLLHLCCQTQHRQF